MHIIVHNFFLTVGRAILLMGILFIYLAFSVTNCVRIIVICTVSVVEKFWSGKIGSFGRS